MCAAVRCYDSGKRSLFMSMFLMHQHVFDINSYFIIAGRFWKLAYGWASYGEDQDCVPSQNRRKVGFNLISVTILACMTKLSDWLLDSLHSKFGITCTATEDDVDIFVSGYAFRLKILHERGLSLVKKHGNGSFYPGQLLDFGYVNVLQLCIFICRWSDEACSILR